MLMKTMARVKYWTPVYRCQVCLIKWKRNPGVATYAVGRAELVATTMRHDESESQRIFDHGNRKLPSASSSLASNTFDAAVMLLLVHVLRDKREYEWPAASACLQISLYNVISCAFLNRDVLSLARSAIISVMVGTELIPTRCITRYAKVKTNSNTN